MRRSKIDYTAWDRIGSELQKRFGRGFIKNDAADDDDTDDDRDEKRSVSCCRAGSLDRALSPRGAATFAAG
jgi:hypothetical protein